MERTEERTGPREAFLRGCSLRHWLQHTCSVHVGLLVSDDTWEGTPVLNANAGRFLPHVVLVV